MRRSSGRGRRSRRREREKQQEDREERERGRRNGRSAASIASRAQRYRTRKQRNDPERAESNAEQPIGNGVKLFTEFKQRDTVRSRELEQTLQSVSSKQTRSSGYSFLLKRYGEPVDDRARPRRGVGAPFHWLCTHDRAYSTQPLCSLFSEAATRFLVNTKKPAVFPPVFFPFLRFTRCHFSNRACPPKLSVSVNRLNHHRSRLEVFQPFQVTRQCGSNQRTGQRNFSFFLSFSPV